MSTQYFPPTSGLLDLRGVRGSYEFNVCSFDAARLDQVRHACESLALAARSGLAFRICTIGGGPVATIDPNNTRKPRYLRD